MAGLGAFLGGLAAGAQNGLQMGQTLKGVIQEGKANALREKAMQEATDMRNSAIADMIKSGGLPTSASPSSTSTPAATAPTATDASAAATGDDSPYLTDAQASQIAAQANNGSLPTAANPAGSQPAAAAASQPNTGNVGAATKEPGAISADEAAAKGIQTLQPKQPKQPAAAAGLPDAGTPASPATQKATDIATATAADAATQAAPAATPTATGQTLYTVQGKQYDNYDDAHKAAEALAPSVMDNFIKNGAPQIEQLYLQQGNIDKANAWRKYIDDKDTRQHLNEWSSAWRMASLGNYEGAAQHLFNLYKQYDDGVTPVGKPETVKDKDGNVTGFNITTQNDQTGEKATQFIDKDKLLSVGLTALAPPQMFEKAYEQQMTMAKYKAQQQLELLKDDNTTKRVLGAALIGGKFRVAAAHEQGTARADGMRDAASIRANAPTPLMKNIPYLQGQGYTNDQIEAMVGHSANSALGKAPSPDTIRMHIQTALMNNQNVRFADSTGKKMLFSQLSRADQQRVINDAVASGGYSGGAGSTSKTVPAAVSQSPAAAGLPPMLAPSDLYGNSWRNVSQPTTAAPAAAPAATRKIYNVKTGRIEDQ